MNVKQQEYFALFVCPVEKCQEELKENNPKVDKSLQRESKSNMTLY
jgi:hypothetical protein